MRSGQGPRLHPAMWLLVAAGACASAFTLAHLTLSRLTLELLAYTLIALALGTRIGIKVTRARLLVTASDALVVLALFAFDGEPAVLLALLSSLVVAARSRKDARTALAGASLSALALYLCALTLRALLGPLDSLHEAAATALPALTVVAFIQTALVVTSLWLSGERAARKLPADFFVTFVVFFAIACLAGASAHATASWIKSPALAALLLAALAHLLHALQRRREDLAVTATHATLPRTASTGMGIFQEAFEHAAIGMAVVSSNGKWLRVNRSLCDLLGYEEAELVKKGLSDVLHPDDLASALESLKDLLDGETQTYRTEKRFLHKQGRTVWILWSVARVVDEETDSVRLISQAQDITDRKHTEQQLQHDAFHDVLTGLPNRALFIDHVNLAIARSKRDGRLFAVLFLDLDRFKVINDSLGHIIGDQLLVGIARRLEKCLREGDTVARVGGDEFTILLEDLENETEATRVAERIQTELSAPFNLDSHEVFTTASIGIAPSSTSYDDPEDLLRDADTAMYRAKSSGKARHEVFDKEMHAIAVNLLQIETDLRRALDRRELYVLYQPIVALDDFRLCGFEALARWDHPERGLISPMDFIPIAEDTGQIVPIGEWALLEACRQMRRWQSLFPPEAPLFVCVNLSGKQFTQPNLIERVGAILEQTRLSPRCLKLEITESVVMENIETATEMLRQLRELGVQLAIDDFGTGYSSLSYLHRFPIDTLKIDRSFVTRMADNNENMEIVRTIVMLAQVLGMSVVAEGVETKDQLAMLRRLGCENGQGYYFSRPVRPAEAEKMIAETCAPPKSPANKAPSEKAAPLMDDKVKAIRLSS